MDNGRSVYGFFSIHTVKERKKERDKSVIYVVDNEPYSHNRRSFVSLTLQRPLTIHHSLVQFS
jgi:hypothetical protein